MFIGANNLYKTTNDGTTWEKINVPGVVGLQTTSSHLVAASGFGGVYIANMAGDSWTKVYQFNNLTPFTLLADKDTLYLGMSWSGGIYKSTDLGTTWTQVGGTNLSAGTIREIIKYHNHIVVGTYYLGTWITDDGAVSWQRASVIGIGCSDIQGLAVHGDDLYGIGTGVSSYDSTNFVWHPLPQKEPYQNAEVWHMQFHNGKLFVSTNKDIWMSPDLGNSWSKRSDINGALIETLVADGNTLYAVSGNDAFYNTTDNGITWNMLPHTDSLFAGNSDEMLCFGDTLMARVMGDINVSFDKGATWRKITDSLPARLAARIFRINNRLIISVVYTNNTYGLLYSDDWGGNWHATSGCAGGILTFIVSGSGKSFTSVRDSGLYQSTDNGLSWSKVNFALRDNRTVFSARYYNNVFYLATDSGLAVSTNAGVSWTMKIPAIDRRVLWITRHNNDVFAAGLSAVFKLDNQTHDPVLFANYPAGLEMNSVETFGDKMFFGSWGAGIYYIDLSAQTSIEDVQNDISLQVFPNPANNILNLHSDNNIIRATFYNMAGQMVLAGNVFAQNAALDISVLPEGVYLVRLTGETFEKTVKVIKAK